MVTLFEFLGNEPIENVFTCMKYAVYKVIFFGYADSISGFRNSHTSFLTKHCGVREVLFSALPGNDLQPILTAMRSVIGNELEHGANIYFDITGGEDLILVVENPSWDMELSGCFLQSSIRRCTGMTYRPTGT